jgi:hypothetical protein
VSDERVDDELYNAVADSVRAFLEKSDGRVDSTALIDLGWPDLYAESAPTALSALFFEGGRGCASLNLFDVMLSAALGGAHELTWLHPLPGLPVPRLGIGQPGDVIDGIVVASPTLPAEDSPFVALIGCQDGRGQRLMRVTPTSALSVETVRGVDAAAQSRPVSARVEEEWPGDARLLASLAFRAVAYSLLGVGTRLLDIARTHVSAREQFGRPIGSYQAVRHQLADMYVALEAAGSVLRHTWRETNEFDLAVGIARVLASDALWTCLRGSMQVCGGMGFTEEFPLARLIRRGLFLEGWYGQADALRSAVGADASARSSVARLGTFEELG